MVVPGGAPRAGRWPRSRWAVVDLSFREPGIPVYRHNSDPKGPERKPGSLRPHETTGVEAIEGAHRPARAGGGSGRRRVVPRALALVRDDAEMERVNPGHGRGLIWLVGTDGNANTEDYPEEQAVQRRMLLRRTQAILVPVADTMPSGADLLTDG